MADKTISNPKTNGDSPQPSASGLTANAAHRPSAYHKQLAALNCSVRDWIVKHVNANALCDLTPIFKDYERHLAGIEQQHGGGGGGGGSGCAETQPPSLLASAQLEQESAFLFHGNKAEGASEKTEAGPEARAEPPLGAASASFSFGKKIDSSVLGPLNSGPLTGFSFPSGSSGLFSKDVTQSKPVSSPFSAKTSENQAGGGSNDCKGEYKVRPPRSVCCLRKFCVYRK